MCCYLKHYPLSCLHNGVASPALQVDYTIDTLKVQLYSTTGGKVRLVLEVVLFLAIWANIVFEFRGWGFTMKRKVSVKPASAGCLVDSCMHACHDSSCPS